MNAFLIACYEIGWVAFEKVRLVGAKNIQVSRSKALHVVACYQCALPTYYPGDLYLFMPMKVLVKMRKFVLLQMNGIVNFNW